MNVVDSAKLSPLLIGLVLYSGPAWAAPGDHIRLGEFTLTPSVSAALEFHSNVYLTDSDPEWAPDILVAPRLALQAEKPDWTFNGGLGYQLRKYIDPDPSDVANIQNLDRFNEVNASVGLNVLKRSVLGFRLDDRFQIVNTPAELDAAPDSANIVTTSNDLNGGLLIRPGSAIEIGALGQLGIDSYKVPDGFTAAEESNAFNDRSSYGPALDLRWKFLPKTTLRGGGSLIWNTWRQNLIHAAGPEAEGVDYGEYLGKPDSIAWRTLWGVKGQFTEKVSAEVAAGYGQAYYDEESVLTSAQAGALEDSSAELDLTGSDTNGETFARDLKSFREGLLVQAQVGWAPIEKQTFNLGYKKDFQDAFFTNYVAYNYLYLRYEGVVATKLGLRGEVGWRLDAFHGEVARKDSNLELKGQATWQVTSFFSTTAGLGWRERACGNAGCQGGVFEPTEYDDVYGSLGATLQY